MRLTSLRREQELAAVRSDFVAAVSHEIRTPLAQIRLFAELLRTNSLRGKAEVELAWNVIEKEAGRLTILVDNVLSYARLTRGRARGMVPDGAHAADVSRDVAYVIDAFAPLAAERDVRIVHSAPSTLNAAVDSQALRQILLNLLENAVKYGPRGQTISLQAVRALPNVQIPVSDEGPGGCRGGARADLEAFRAWRRRVHVEGRRLGDWALGRSRFGGAVWWTGVGRALTERSGVFRR